MLTFISAPDFETPTDANLDGVYEVTVQVDDNNTGIDTQALSVTVTNVNDAPVHLAPAAAATPQDTGLVFSTAAGNRISISDDAGSNLIEVTLTAAAAAANLEEEKRKLPATAKRFRVFYSSSAGKCKATPTTKGCFEGFFPYVSISVIGEVSDITLSYFPIFPFSLVLLN